MHRLVTTFFLAILSALTVFASGAKDVPKAKYGDAVVVVSTGRGGSTWFCDIVRHTSSENTAGLLLEVLGNNASEMNKVNNPTKVVVEYLNRQRREHSTGLVGFKLKPYVDNEAYNDMYQYFAEEEIPVLFLSRNHLDRTISGEKHDEINVAAHCKTGDHLEKCLEKHKRIKPTVSTNQLIKHLDHGVKLIADLEEKFKKLNVKFLRVSYDIFAFGCEDQKLEILQQILDFLYPKKGKKADMELFRTEFVATSDRNQSNVVANYPEVVKLLSGTQYESLLRTADPPCPNDQKN